MTLREHFRFVRLTIILLLLSPVYFSCATCFNGTRQDISFRSNQDGLSINVLDSFNEIVFTGKTPCTASLKRGRGYFLPAVYTVVVKDKQSHRSLEFPQFITGSANVPSYEYLNFFWGIGGYIIVDPITGGMWNLYPNNIQIDLPVSKDNKMP